MSLPRDDAHQSQAHAHDAASDALEQRQDAEADTPPQHSESWLVHLPSAALLSASVAMTFAFGWPDWIPFVVGVPASVLLFAATRRWLSRAR